MENGTQHDERWGKRYVGVILFLLVQIIVYYWFSRVFS